VKDVEVQELYGRLKSSLSRCKELCVKIGKAWETNPSSGRLVLFEGDFREEESYHCFLEGIDLALERILTRYFPHLDPEVAKQERQVAKYRELFVQIERIETSLNRSRVCSEVSGC